MRVDEKKNKLRLKFLDTDKDEEKEIDSGGLSKLVVER